MSTRQNYFHSSIKILLFFIILLFTKNIYSQEADSLVRAGLRSSTYGFSTFPDSSWWYNATTDMASKFSDKVSPTVIWIVGYISNNDCYLNFPNPNPDLTYPNIFFGFTDKNKKYLDDFDNNGLKVWLQVEPGLADVSTLIDLVLTQYGNHKCVIGLGVDIEWYKTSNDNNNEGKAVTDEEAIAWSNKIRSYDEEYLLFTKHWLINKMPPTFRDNIVFVDDSQSFSMMDNMIDEFAAWGNTFAPAKVAFQYGYDSDRLWWQDLSDPPKEIGNNILRRCSNVSDLFWVDFTAYDIWPEDFTINAINDKQINSPNAYRLLQNYPNPFNPSTTIKYEIPSSSTAGKQAWNDNVNVTLKVYDVLGCEIATLINKQQQPGNYVIKWSAGNQPSGVYFYKLKAGNFIETKKMLLAK